MLGSKYNTGRGGGGKNKAKIQKKLENVREEYLGRKRREICQSLRTKHKISCSELKRTFEKNSVGICLIIISFFDPRVSNMSVKGENVVLTTSVLLFLVNSDCESREISLMK